MSLIILLAVRVQELIKIVKCSMKGGIFLMNQIDTGKFIASYRKEKGLTQVQLAEKLNITDRAVSKWETGVSHS